MRAKTRTWAGVLLLAAFVRSVVAFGVLGSMPLVSDARDYSEMAALLARTFPGDLPYYWPPGNAYVLAAAYAAFGVRPAVARAVAVLLGTAWVALVMLLTRRAAKDERAFVVAGLFAAIYPPSVMLAGQIYAQHLAAVLLAATAYAAVRAFTAKRIGFFLLAGALLGAGCLTRPSMASLVPFLLVGVLLAARGGDEEATRRVLSGALLGAVVALAITIPVAAHDRSCGAGFVLSTNNERNFFLGNNPYTPNYKTSHLGQRALEDLDPETRGYLESFYTRPDARDAMRSEALDYIAHHPLVTLYRTLNRATSFWGFDYLASREIQEDKDLGSGGLAALLLLEAGGYLLVAALALAGWAIFGEETEPAWRAWLLLLTVGYALPYAFAFSGGTYHFPVMGLLIPFAAVALEKLREILPRLVRKPWAMVALAVFFVIQLEYGYYAIAMR